MQESYEKDYLEREGRNLDMWNVLVFIWKMREESFDPEVQAKALSERFDISRYYAKALIKRVEEMEQGKDVSIEV
jgi:DNA-binding MarR family transcriptional regulator